jgi:hypothetical protein
MMRVVKNWSPRANRAFTPYTRKLVDLEVGDAIRVPGGERERNRLSANASRWGKRLGRRFRTSVEDGYVFVWREA